LMCSLSPSCLLFPYTTLFRSYAIGVDNDQDGLQPGHVLTSMVKWVDRGVEQVVTEYANGEFAGGTVLELGLAEDGVGLTEFEHTDRKSTRLNSSHVKISYAVF